MDRNYDTVTFILKYPFFEKAWRGIFNDIIEIVTMFIKTTIKDLGKVKRVRNYVSKSNLYLYFLI